MMGKSVTIEPFDSNGSQFRALRNQVIKRDEGEEQSPDSRQDSYLPKGTEITGSLFFQGPAVIDGRVQGDIQGADKIAINENGVVTADKISARSVIIGGVVTVKTIKGRLIKILATGRVVGDVAAHLFAIHEGAQFQGNVLAGDCPSHPAPRE